MYMRDKFISEDRKKYLRKIRMGRIAVFATQIRNSFCLCYCLGGFSKSKNYR